MAKRRKPALRSPVRVKDSGLLGRIAQVSDTEPKFLVQFGADGPFRWLNSEQLEMLTEREIKGTHLEGTG